MKNRIIRFQQIISITLIAFFTMTVSVFASSTLLTYSGSGIRGKLSVNSFTLNNKTTVTLKHTNKSWSYVVSDDAIMDVTFYRKGLLGHYSATAYKMRTYGTGTTTQTFPLPKDTYKLYFNTIRQGASANISGTVTN